MDKLTRDATIRGLIMDALNSSSPGVFSDLVLGSLVGGYAGFPGLSIDQVRAHLHYLAGKNYIKIVLETRDIWKVQIDSEGTRLCAGAVKDPLVTVR